MKKTIQCVGIGVLLLCTVLSGCGHGFDKGKTAAGNTGTGSGKPSFNGSNKGEVNRFVPDNIGERTVSALSPEQKAEIEKLYGYYWIDSTRDNCIKISADGLVSYSTAMSFSYTNIRWGTVSDSWVCCSYHSSNADYEPSDRKVILKFIKDPSGIQLLQYVVPMDKKAGPFVKGRAVEETNGRNQEGNEQKYYVYDKADPSSPKMLEPIPR